MKTKGEIEDLKSVKKKEEEKEKKKQTSKKKNDHKNGKDISRTFSGGVVGSVGSVHFRIVPWSGLYFLRSILPRRFPLF